MKKLLQMLGIIFIGTVMLYSILPWGPWTLPETQEIEYTVKNGDTLWSVVEPYVPKGHDVRYYIDLTIKASGKKNHLLKTNEKLILVVPKPEK